MDIKQVPIKSLIPYARNARTHTDAQVAQIAASIREFGWTNPILVDGDKGIIAGHGRILAARKLEMETVPVIELSHMTEAQKRAYVLADNKLALNAGWDYEMLSLELGDLKASDFDLSLAGFGDIELNALIGTALTPPSIDGQTDASEEWEGMPEFDQPDDTSFRQLIVHFKDEYDVAEFFGMIGQSFTPRTKSIWYPEQERRDTESRRYSTSEAE
jgi:hypothetical protein